jgi:hypothetical protein
LHSRFENFAAFGVVRKLIETRASRRQQDDIARLAMSRGIAHRGADVFDHDRRRQMA